MAEEPQVGFVTMGAGRVRGRHPLDRHRHARLRLHGQGAHERAKEDRLHHLAAAVHPAARRDRRTERGGGRGGGASATATRSGRRLARTWSTTRTSRSSTTAARTTLHFEPTIAAAKAGKHIICEKPLGRTADESFEIWKARRGDGRQAHVRLQLPLLPGDPARQADDRRGRARRDLPLPGPLPPGVDHGSAVPEGLAARQGDRGLGRARRPRRARDRPVPLPRRRADGGQRRS